MPQDKPQTTPIRALGDTKLFQPIQVGRHTLAQRIAFAPSTRRRATSNHVATDISLDYYKARAQAPGTLIITEATFASPQAGGGAHVPGIFTSQQIQAWKKITDAIRSQGSFSCVQLWHLGRVADPALLKSQGLDFVAPSAEYVSDESHRVAHAADNELRPFTTEEIEDLIHHQYPTAARNALDAGFDYVEIHSAHGYTLDQFLNPETNKRHDEYGGASIENRTRVLLQIIDQLIPIVGADRLAVRLSPWAKFQVTSAVGPETHAYILTELQRRADSGNQLAYVSLVEPRVQGSYDVDAHTSVTQSNEFALKIWQGKVIRAGNYTYDAPQFDTLLRDLDDDRTIIGFSRFFISNPDLVWRLKHGVALNHYQRDTFYNQDNWGYNTWNSHDEDRVWDEAHERRVFGRALA
ncbi:uncharacterized protein LODBEIA_P42060 [Lodderomyces beijingensis]|uniref:NADH:flavin oxidoreductase/NADH oxidase N-terminal domain-containing protein n=1 Tax=Lodderomyces beijingensis TaxID=1775926 RepID=A0ABP0ZRK4_9ASCO